MKRVVQGDPTIFKIGDKVRISDTTSKKYGYEGKITTIGLNGCVVRFPSNEGRNRATGTIVMFTHIELV